MEYKFMRSLTAPMRRQVLADLNHEFNNHQFAENMDAWVENKIDLLPELFDPTSPEPDRFLKADYMEFRKEVRAAVREFRDDFLFKNEKVPSANDFQSAAFDSVFYPLFYSKFPISPYEATKSGPWDFLTLVVLPEIAHMRFSMFVPSPSGLGEKSSDVTFVPSQNSQDRHYGRPDTRGRKVFERIWMRAQLAEGEFSLLYPLSEDNLVGIFERSAILANRRYARALLEAICSFKEDCLTEKLKNSENVVRDLMKRAVRLTSLHSISDLPIGQLQTEIRKMLMDSNLAFGNTDYKPTNLFERKRGHTD